LYPHCRPGQELQWEAVSSADERFREYLRVVLRFVG
jgi:hypothetical protein